MSKKIKFEHPSFEYIESDVIVMVPSVKIVCPNCNGEGSHDRTDLDMSRMMDMWKEDGDYEAIENYMSGHSFQETCTYCQGKNVIDDMDFEYFVANYPKHYQAYKDWVEAERESIGIGNAERQMGA